MENRSADKQKGTHPDLCGLADLREVLWQSAMADRNSKTESGKTKLENRQTAIEKTVLSPFALPLRTA